MNHSRFLVLGTNPLALLLSVVLCYGAAPAGFNWIFRSGKDAIEQAVQRARPRPGPFTDARTLPRPSASRVGRNEYRRGGIDGPEDLSNLLQAESARFDKYAARHPELLEANTTARPLFAEGGPPVIGEPEPGEGLGGQDSGQSFHDMHEDGIGPSPSDFYGGGTDSLGSPPIGGGFGWVDPTRKIHLNTNTGNLVTTVPITGWSGKGDSYVDFTLVHNSRQSATLGAITDIGHSWSHSYSIEFNYTADPFYSWPPPMGATAYLIWIDGQRIKFTYNGVIGSGGGARFDPPPGYHAHVYYYVGPNYMLKTKDGWTYNFNSDGHVTSQVDPWGNQVTINRNGYNEITSVSDGLGRSLVFFYSSGKITHVTAPDGKMWQFTRDSSGNLIDIEYPELDLYDHHVLFGYNSTWDITSYTNTLGKVWTYTYDQDSRLTSTTNPLNKTWSVTYNTSYAQLTNPLDQSVYHYYENGRLKTYQDEANYVINFWADADENLTLLQDKRGKFWTWTYDSQGNMLSEADPLGRTWQYTYNPQNNVTAIKNPQNTTVVTIGYGSGPAPVVIDDALYSPVREFAYSATGELLSSSIDFGTTSLVTATYEYDAYKNVTEVTDSAGVSVSATYDVMGRPLTVTDPANETTEIFYDDWGRPYMLDLPDESTVSIDINHGGQVTSATDELNRSGYVGYNDAGYVTSTTNAKSETHTFGYDNAGRVVTVTNARGKTRTYTYTVRGEVYTLTLPDSSVESWAYDANGNVASYTNALNQTIGYAYNDAGDQTLVDYPTGTDTSFGYDALGRWTSMTDSTGASSCVYNLLGQVTSLTTPQGSFTCAYNNVGQPLTMTDASGTWTTLYDSNLRAYGLTNPWNETTTVTFDNTGRVVRKDMPHGMYETYQFDERSRLTHIRTYDSSQAMQDTKQYLWDPASRVTGAFEGGIWTYYGYDLVDQLTSESKPSLGYTADYTYDANGNRLTRTINSVTETYAYDDADKLLSVAGGPDPRTFSYDAAGRTTAITGSGGSTSFTYDYESRVTSITYPNQTSDFHTYNGLDARVNSSGVNGTKTFRRAGIGVTSPVMSDGTTDYTPGISSRQNGASKFQHDGLKNALEQSNSSQSFSGARNYDAFGNLAATSGSWQGSYGYGADFGYEEDPNGLKLLGHRYYDASSGRFLSRGRDGAGRNWYAMSPEGIVDGGEEEELPKLIIVIGAPYVSEDDEDGKDGAIPALRELAELYKDKYSELGWNPVIVEQPTEEELAELLEDADGLIFLGHGSRNGNYGRLRGNPREATATDKLTPELIRRAKKGRKLRLLILEACHLGSGQGWYDLAEFVYGHAGLGIPGRRVKDWGKKGSGFAPKRLGGGPLRRPTDPEIAKERAKWN